MKYCKKLKGNFNGLIKSFPEVDYPCVLHTGLLRIDLVLNNLF
jgi:hypothetical protein